MAHRSGVVLIVDDHAALTRSLVSLLKVSGFAAHAVHSGAEALAFVGSDAAVALILLDMSMPDMSGFDVLRALRAPGAGDRHPIPIVMISADDDAMTREAVMRLGATGFVPKTDPRALLRIVEENVRPSDQEE